MIVTDDFLLRLLFCNVLREALRMVHDGEGCYFISLQRGIMISLVQPIAKLKLERVPLKHPKKASMPQTNVFGR